MGGLLLFEGEELILRFRPHPVAYFRRYVSALLWFVPAGVAASWPTWFAGARAVEWGLAVFIMIGLAWSFALRRAIGTSLAYAWFASLTACALIVARVFDWPPVQYPDWLLGLLLGGFLALTRIVLHEMDRVARLHFLTTERLVVRGGLKSRRERSLSLKKILEVRSERPLFGQFFDFGNLSLVQSRTLRGKDAKIHEDIESLQGVSPLSEIQYNVEQLVEEARLPARDRKRRLEERRVKDSMRRLAAWMRRGNRQPRA